MESKFPTMFDYVVSMIHTYIDVEADGLVSFSSLKRQVWTYEEWPLISRSLVTECAKAAKIKVKSSNIKGKLRRIDKLPDERIAIINSYFGTNFIPKVVIGDRW